MASLLSCFRDTSKKVHPSKCTVVDMLLMETDETKMAAVKHDPWMLKQIKDKERTPALCKQALIGNSQLIKHVPTEIKKNPSFLIWMTKESEVLCDEAIRIDPLMFINIDANKRTFDRCIDVVTSNYAMMIYVPNNHREAVDRYVKRPELVY